MRYHRFGRTELSLPVLSCGGMRYQFKWQDVPPEDIPTEGQDNLEAIIGRALELGWFEDAHRRFHQKAQKRLSQS